MSFDAGVLKWCPICRQAVNASNYARHRKRCTPASIMAGRPPAPVVVTYEGLELVWDPYFGDALAHALRQPSPLVDGDEP